MRLWPWRVKVQEVEALVAEERRDEERQREAVLQRQRQIEERLRFVTAQAHIARGRR